MPPEISVFIARAVLVVFEFVNGFHDTANAMATSVATRVYTDREARIMCLLGNFLGVILAVVTGGQVAKVVGNDIINPLGITVDVVTCGLAGAAIWGIATWWYSIPSSSSHALIGGLMGAAFMFAGDTGILWDGFIKAYLGLVLSAVVAGVFGMFVVRILPKTRTDSRIGNLKIFSALAFVVGILCLLVAHITPVSPKWVGRLNFFSVEGVLIGVAGWIVSRHMATKGDDAWYSHLQKISAFGMSVAHGNNDGMKSVGVWILIGNVVAGARGDKSAVDLVVLTFLALVLAAGSGAGSKRLTDAIGEDLAGLTTRLGVGVESVAMSVILAAGQLGLPVSTTHIVVMLVVAICKADGQALRASRKLLLKLAGAWIFTIPASGLIGAGLVRVFVK